MHLKNEEIKSVKDVRMKEHVLSSDDVVFEDGVIVGYRGCVNFDENTLVIPDFINGTPILSIAEGAFMCCGIRSVKFETKHLHSIRDGAFKKNLINTVNIPLGVVEMGIDVFSNESGPIDIYLSETVEVVGENLYRI